jgi:hypothetical protein
MYFSFSYLGLIEDDPTAYEPFFEMIRILKDFLKPKRITKNFKFWEEWEKKAIEEFGIEQEKE